MGFITMLKQVGFVLLHNVAVSKVARIPATLGVARHMGLVNVLEGVKEVSTRKGKLGS